MPPIGPKLPTSPGRRLPGPKAHRLYNSLSKICLLTAAALAVSSGSFAAEGVVLLPGVDVHNITFQTGAWCRYVVVDEAEGIVDSAELYVAVVGEEALKGGESAHWVEFRSGPWGGEPAEMDAVSVLVSDAVRGIAEGDSLYRYMKQVYHCKGTGPAEPGDPRKFQQLTLTSPTSGGDWQSAPATVATPAGEIDCIKKETTVTESREISRGRVKLVKSSVDRFVVWTSDAAPVFHLVRCEIERTRNTRTVPAIRGIPDPGERYSRTTTMLMEHGNGAKRLVVPPSQHPE